MRLFKVIFGLSIICVCILGFLFPCEHPHYFWQKIPIFDAIFGFIGCIVLILFSKGIGHHFLQREENYYED